MNTRKYILSATRLVLPTIGLSLIFAGAYIKSIQNRQLQILIDISTYLFIILGFLLLIVGVFWSLCHGMKNVLLKRSLRRSRDTDVQIFTVDRSHIFPPSYEECQVRNNVAEFVPSIISMEWVSLAPPLYTQTTNESLVEDFSHEEPPTYQQAVPQNPNTSCLPINNSVEPLC